MASIKSSLSAALCVLPAVLGQNLLVSHYNGNVYSVSFSGTALAIKSQIKAGGQMPSWLTLDAASGSVWVTDESTGGSNKQMYQLTVGSDLSLKSSGTSKANGGELHSCLYGGSDGKGYIAAAE
jgi:hypothetical protein